MQPHLDTQATLRAAAGGDTVARTHLARLAHTDPAAVRGAVGALVAANHTARGRLSARPVLLDADLIEHLAHALLAEPWWTGRVRSAAALAALVADEAAAARLLHAAEHTGVPTHPHLTGPLLLTS